MRWDQLRTVHDVWFWVQHAFIPAVFHEDPSTVPLQVGNMFGTQATLGVPSLQPGLLLRWSQAIGGVRLRQRRVVTENCPGDPAVTKVFAQTCHGIDPLVSAFGSAAQQEGLFAPGFVPESAERGTFDVYIDIQRPIYEVLETMEHMLWALGWLDDSTQELLLQAAFVNGEASPALYGFLEVQFIFDPSGALRQNVRVRTTAADDYPDILYVMLDIVWAILVFSLLVANVVMVIQRVLSPGLRDEQPLLTIWTALDWITILVSMGIMVGRFLMSLSTSQVATKIANVPSSPPAFGASYTQMKAYHQTWGDALDDVINITQYAEYYRFAIFVYMIVLTCDIFKVFRGQPKLTQLATVLAKATEDLIHYVVAFLVFFCSFAFTGYLIYGLTLPEWSRPARAINTSFRSLLGDTDLAAMYEVAPVSTVIWYFLFLTIMIFLMLNLLFAITFDHYSIMKTKVGKTSGIMPQLRLLFSDMRSRGLLASLCCCCRRDPSYPRHSDMLRDFMDRCDLPLQERRSAFDTVLGLRMHRKERKRNAFGDGVATTNETMQLLQKPAAADLKVMGVDPDYAEVLMEDGVALSKREHGSEECKVSQLRELVHLAEGDIVFMRHRLHSCQTATKSAMYEFTSRLEVLERLVHNSLADLVLIAGSIGVPDAKPAQSPSQRAKLDSTVGALRSLSPAARSETMLSGSIGRVLDHLGQTSNAGKDGVSASIRDWHRAMRRVDTRGKRVLPGGSSGPTNRYA